MPLVITKNDGSDLEHHISNKLSLIIALKLHAFVDKPLLYVLLGLRNP